MLEVSQVQMEWVYQDGVEAAGGLSEGLHSVKVNQTTTCKESETKGKAAPANASQGSKNSSQRNGHQQHLTVKLLFFFSFKTFYLFSVDFK